MSIQIIAKALGHNFARMAERYVRPSEEAMRAISTALDGETNCSSNSDTPGAVVVGRANPLWVNGAGDGARTHDIQLGKLTFYH